MIMRRLGILLSLILLAAWPDLVQAKSRNKIKIQCQIFKFTGTFLGKTFVDEPIWTTDEPPEALMDKVNVFNRGWFEIGRDRLEFKNGRCFWKGKEFPIDGSQKDRLPEEKIELIYSPVIVMYEHDSSRVKIESKQPIQYFEKRSDGLFELKEVKLPTGLDIDIEAREDEKKGYILLTDLVMRLRSIEGREKIEGVNLAVGRPILGRQKYVFYFRIRPGKDYGILIKPERGQGALLVRLRATSTHSGTFIEKGK